MLFSSNEQTQTIPELYELYKEYAYFSSKVRYFASLDFVPPSDVSDVYEKVLKLDIFVKNN